MAVNQYFNQTSFASEQNLLEDLVVESIQIHGQDFYYIERTEVNSDTVFNEATLSEFNTAIGLAPIVKISLNIPPTPVAAP